MIKYTLFENAIDSIENGIEHLEIAIKNNDKKHYKHSLLNLFQGTELLIKEILVRKDPIIIFDKNSLYKKCEDFNNPKIEELYNCKSIDINELCVELKKHYPSNFDNLGRNIIKNIAKERNKIQHFAIQISPATLKSSLIQLYGKVIKPCFEIINYSNKSEPNIFGEMLEELYCLFENANREEAMLKIKEDDYTRGDCYNCNHYSMFVFYDKSSYPTRFYCTSCPLKNDSIEISEFRECPECGANSLLYNDNLIGGICLYYKCSNHLEGGIITDMIYCDNCKDYEIEGICNCELN